MSSSCSPVAVFIVDLLRGYGSERYTVQLVNVLAASGIPVDLILQDKGNSLVNEVDVRVRKVDINTRNPFATLLFLYRYLKETRPRALFTTMEKPSLLGLVAGALARYRNVVPTMHVDIDAYAINEHAERRKLLRFLVASLYRRAPAVVAVSQGVAKTLRNLLGPRTRIVTILNGFDLVTLRQRAEEKIPFPWLAEKEEPVIIGCGRFVPMKGFDVLIKAFALVRKEAKARLIILGDGSLRPELENLVRNLGLQDHVALPGYAENPQAWIAQSDVFVLSSRSEGFGNVLVEALVAGTAVVSTDCPSGPRNILDGGRYGALVPVDDIHAMAEAMKKALARQPEARESSRIQAYINARFSSQTMAAGYLALVESLEA